MILQDPTALRSALASALDAARQQNALPVLVSTPEAAPPLSPAAAVLVAAAARRAAASHTLAASSSAGSAASAASAGAGVFASATGQPRAAGARTAKPRSQRASAPAPRRTGQRITDLQDLATIARQLREQQARAQAQEQARREATARREAEHHLFSRAVGAITELRTRNRIHLPDPPPLPLPVQHWLDEERVLRESISDDFDVSTLLDTDDQLSFRRPGIGVEITQRLRAGHWSIQRQLDLHGLRVDEAREALGQFIRQSHRGGMRCVRVVHGKGLGSPGKSPVLKSRVQRWLVQKTEVLAFVQARPVDGGAGALLVLLQPVGQRRH